MLSVDFKRLSVGGLVSQLGDTMYETTLALWIATQLLQGKSYAPSAVGGLLIVTAIAVFLTAPFAGVFTDRWDKRRTMLACDLARAGAIGTTAVLLFILRTQPPQASIVIVYVSTFAVTGIGQFFQPARFTLVNDLVSGDVDRARAAGITSATGSVAAIIGPPLAAPLLVLAGIQPSMIFNVSSYIVSFLLIATIRVPTIAKVPSDLTRPPIRRGFTGQFTEGLHYCLSNRFVITLTLSIVVMTIGGGAINTLDVFFVTENLGAPAKFYGIVAASFGVGAILGALGGSRVVRRIGAARSLACALLGTGLTLTIYSRLTSLTPAVGIIALCGLCMGIMNSSVGPILMRQVPRSLLGRVQSFITPVVFMAQLLGAALSGWLASSMVLNLHLDIAGVSFGRLDLLLGSAGILIVLGGVYATFRLPEPKDSGTTVASSRRRAARRPPPAARSDAEAQQA